MIIFEIFSYGGWFNVTSVVGLMRQKLFNFSNFIERSPLPFAERQKEAKTLFFGSKYLYGHRPVSGKTANHQTLS
ncbi:hypothetical protein [Vibrio quintilis]|uniref:Uncharacterized protein n=1 Tax=Vibrio quintilis TaxID=1117707 RepID=A0A1M7YZ87_9VIBR|nr:hypothetical protein [Vibrio quintilis]SHO57940.1 hypothetical protein VQ7734_03710 [Vibrio quintilis]